jgi:hypothetical protein
MLHYVGNAITTIYTGAAGKCESLNFACTRCVPKRRSISTGRRHLNSFPLFGIEAHGFWTAKEDVEPRLFVLASYAAGDDSGEVARRYMQSTEFADDIRNFDVSDIVGVDSTILIPSTSSPLK